MTYREYYKHRKELEEITAADIFFGWLDYCKKHGIDPYK